MIDLCATFGEAFGLGLGYGQFWVFQANFDSMQLTVINFDGILIYSYSEEDHHLHLQEVLEVLQKNKLYVNLKNCNFMSSKLLFLWYMLSTERIHVDEEKVRVIRDQPIPQTVKKL